MACKLCDVISNENALDQMSIYDDAICTALLSKKPASMCHVIVLPKNHCTIFEQVPDDEVAHIFNVSNKISRAMFEALNVQGTNIFVQNGVAAGQEDPHFSIHIIARTENDGIKLDWQPKTLTQEQMSTIELNYKKIIGGEPKKEVAKIEDKKEKISDEDGENYMVKYFNKIP